MKVYYITKESGNQWSGPEDRKFSPIFDSEEKAFKYLNTKITLLMSSKYYDGSSLEVKNINDVSEGIHRFKVFRIQHTTYYLVYEEVQ